MRKRAITMSVSIPNTLLDQLDEYCHRVVKPRSWVVRKLIEELLGDEKNEQEEDRQLDFA